MSGIDHIHARDRESWQVAEPDAHGRQVRSMFARISGVYDFMNHFLSLNRDRAWRRDVVGRLDADAWEVLDLCAGTGDLALEAVRQGRGRAWIAADFCPEMLAGSRGKRGADQLRLAAADAMALPFRDRIIADIVERSKPFDGVQIDFESISKEDGTNFLNFLAAVKKALPKDKLFSVAVMARWESYKQKNPSDAFDYPFVAMIADRVIVMAYDEHYRSGEAGPIASLPWCEKI